MADVPKFFPLRAWATIRRGLVPFCVIVLANVLPAAAETGWVARTSSLVASASGDATQVATLSVAAELEVLETRGGFCRVAVAGWVREGAERVVFAYPGKRILLAQLAPDVAAQLEPTGQEVDPETSITWNRVRVEGWIEQGSVGTDLDLVWADAWALFSERCTACHERRVPSNYTANQWVSLIKVMGPRAGLPKPDQQLILTFLQHHASDTIGMAGQGSAQLPPDAGR